MAIEINYIKLSMSTAEVVTVPEDRGPASIALIFVAGDSFSLSVTPNLSGRGNFTLYDSGSATYTKFLLYMMHNIPSGTYTVNWGMSAPSSFRASLAMICETSGINPKSQSINDGSFHYPTSPLIYNPVVDSGSMYVDFFYCGGNDFSGLNGQTLRFYESTYGIRIFYKRNVGQGVYTDSYQNSSYMWGFMNGYEFYPAGNVFSIPPLPIG